jgi:hypothetical protein
MPAKVANVFDFDGTLIRVNSFREITKRLLVTLLARGRVLAATRIVLLYAARKCRCLGHLAFKRRVVAIFETALPETVKQTLCQSVFDAHVNESVYRELLSRDECVISTASPFAYISRVEFSRKVPIISSLDTEDSYPDSSNQGPGKVVNLRAYLKAERFEIGCLFTDDPVDDKPLIDVSETVMLVGDGCLRRLK